MLMREWNNKFLHLSCGKITSFKGTNKVKYTTPLPWIGLSGNDSKLYTKFYFCEGKNYVINRYLKGTCNLGLLFTSIGALDVFINCLHKWWLHHGTWWRMFSDKFGFVFEQCCIGIKDPTAICHRLNSISNHSPHRPLNWQRFLILYANIFMYGSLFVFFDAFMSNNYIQNYTHGNFILSSLLEI